MVEGDPAAACRLLGLQVEGFPEVIAASFPTGTLSADLVLRVGPQLLAQVEYMRRASSDLVTRMLGYRYVIMKDHPQDELVQHVLVLGGGRVSGHDEFERRGFALDLRMTYLRDLEPAVMLAEPSMAALATLGRGNVEQRAEAYARALTLIRERTGKRAGDLIEYATTVATIHLDPLVIEKIMEESRMAVESIAEVARIVQNTWLGRTIRQDGLEEGLEQGLEQGLEAGRERMLSAVLIDRFGEHPDVAVLAHRLAAWPDAAAVHAVAAATGLEELAQLQPPG